MDTGPPLRRRLRRREFLIAAAAVGTTAAISDALVTCAPWLDYGAQAKRTWDTPCREEVAVPAQMRGLIRDATLAASGHNAQPWRFTILGDTIQIAPDYSRRLPVVDPQDRELWISLGCALENIEIAAQSAGYGTETAYPGPDADYITLALRPAAVRQPAPLAEAIPHRQNTRSLYDGRAVPVADLGKIEAVTASTGVSLQIITAVGPREAILEYIRAGDRRQYGDPLFLDELVSWLRFNKPEALHTLDGLYTRCSGTAEVPRWLGQRFVTAASAGRQSAIDVTNVRSSSGLVVIAAARDDKRHWIETGRLYERLALTMTALNIKTALLNQPVEVADLRSQLRSRLGLGTHQPQLVLRFGYAAAMPRSLRRPVGQVLS